MRKLLAVGVLVGACLLGSAPSASADTPGCVSRSEFNQIRLGATRQRVTNVFDIAGRVTSQTGSGGFAYERREYNPCSGRYSYVSVSFSKDPGETFTVYSKSAYWG